MSIQSTIPLPAPTNNTSLVGPIAITKVSQRSAIVTLTIPAGATQPLNAMGDRYQILRSPGPVSVRYSVEVGFESIHSGFGLNTETAFTVLEVKNPYLFQIQVSVFYGFDSPSSFGVLPYRDLYFFEGFAALSANNLSQVNSLVTSLVDGFGNKLVSAGPTNIGDLYFRTGLFYGITSQTFAAGNLTPNAGSVDMGYGTVGMCGDTITGGTATVNWMQYPLAGAQLNSGLLNLASFWAKDRANGGTDGLYFKLWA